MSETVEHKPKGNKRLLGAILLALGALLLVGQVAGAIAGVVVDRVAEHRVYQTEWRAEEISIAAERDAELAERNAELAVMEAERIAEQAERDAERASREAERIAAQAEREAERITEQAGRDAERLAAQIERDFDGYVYTVEVERRSPFFFHPFRLFQPYRGSGLIPLALILLGVYLVIRQRRAAAVPVPQTGPEADHGPAV